MRIVLAFVLVVTACGAAPHLASSAVPDSQAGRQLRWLLDVFAKGGSVDEPTLRHHFADEFLAKVPPQKLVVAFGSLTKHVKGMTITKIDAPSPTSVLLHGAVTEARFVLALTVEPTRGLITDLDVHPDEGPPPTSFEDASAKLQTLATTSQLLVAELDHGSCVPVYSINSSAQLALGSTFKLYVLLALVDRITAGALHWDDQIAMRDDWKSLPSGITQDDPAGTKLSVKTLAERMISISDNTAADVLLYTVGRERVEQAVRDSGHTDPARNIPFLGTRELFWFKLEMTDKIGRYLALDPAGRREFLDGLVGKRPSAEADWKTPIQIDTLEWFASGDDLCRLATTLLARAQTAQGAPLLDVLAKNPGMKSSAVWSYVGFKGGSEPGVLNATWLLRRADGHWFIVTLGLDDGARLIDESAAIGLGHGVIELLGR